MLLKFSSSLFPWAPGARLSGSIGFSESLAPSHPRQLSSVSRPRTQLECGSACAGWGAGRTWLQGSPLGWASRRLARSTCQDEGWHGRSRKGPLCIGSHAHRRLDPARHLPAALDVIWKDSEGGPGYLEEWPENERLSGRGRLKIPAKARYGLQMIPSKGSSSELSVK